VRRALDDSGLAGDRLELEVTESLLIDNRDEALRILTELKTLGVRIAMDDFGTGYSSLSYLKSFPFDKIKIDRVFVADLQHDDDNACIVQAVASMGKSLRMRVVAEGVETAGQAAMLEHLQCDELQGFLIAKPMPAAAVARFLRNPHLQAAPPVAEAMPMPPRASPGLVPG
jgi:EAL domain-containing protein (putative c-di-GMP-specific phosphodiesterase class I)